MSWIFERDRLVALREAKGISQDDFASRIGTSKQHVSQWEIGKLVPTTSTLVKIANTFAVSPAFFYVQRDQHDVGYEQPGEVMNDRPDQS